MSGGHHKDATAQYQPLEKARNIELGNLQCERISINVYENENSLVEFVTTNISVLVC